MAAEEEEEGMELSWAEGTRTYFQRKQYKLFPT